MPVRLHSLTRRVTHTLRYEVLDTFRNLPMYSQALNDDGGGGILAKKGYGAYTCFTPFKAQLVSDVSLQDCNNALFMHSTGLMFSFMLISVPTPAAMGGSHAALSSFP